MRSLAVAAAIAISGCGSADESGDLDRWCELTIQNTGNTQSLSDTQLMDWTESAPPEIRNETETLTDVARELRVRMADALPEEQMKVADEALAEAFSDLDTQRAGATVEQYLFENCPDYEG